MITCEPIGTVETSFSSLASAPPQGTDAMGTIHLREEYREGLKGLSVGMSLSVLWWADQGDRSILTYPDRDVGVFALRTPDRPNPICVTACRVVDIDNVTLLIRGVDMLDGSPVIDLKPSLTTDG